MEMTLEQAINNISLILSKYKGTRDEHIALDQSLKLVKDACTPLTPATEK